MHCPNEQVPKRHCDIHTLVCATESRACKDEYVTFNCAFGLKMQSFIERKALSLSANVSTGMDAELYANDTHELHKRKNMASPTSSTAADQKPPTDIVYSHEALDAAKQVNTPHPTGKRSHVCSSCFKTFASNAGLQRHFRARCKPLHNEILPDSRGLVEHRTTAQLTSKGMFICDQCCKSFFSKTDFDLHSELEHGFKQTNLSSHVLPLNMQHSNSFSLKVERDEQDCDNVSEPRYSCHACQVTFADECVLDEHVLVAHSSDALSADKKPLLNELSTTLVHCCNLCPESFEDASGLAEHVRIDHPSASSRAGEERQNSIASGHQSVSLKMATRQAEKPFAQIRHACRCCPEDFEKRATLLRHVCTVHGGAMKHLNVESSTRSKQTGGKKTHSCNQCSRRFRLKGHLTRHQLTHTSVKPFECHLCPATFAQKSTMQRHVQRHTGYKRFACPQCSKRFLIKAAMRNHMRTHTGERPYACDVCSAKFSSRDNLRKHVTTHTGVRPFACQQCPRSFTRYADLRRHSRRHTGERPFACTSCPRTFTRQTLLRDHIEAAHHS